MFLLKNLTQRKHPRVMPSEKVVEAMEQYIHVGSVTSLEQHW